MFKPTQNRVLVIVEKEKKPKKGEEPAGNSIMTANVIAVGLDVKDIKIDDKVSFAPYGFDEIVYNGKKHVVITEDLILGIHDQK